MTIILGISALYHDSAAAIIKDGKILSAIQEERISRIKHDPSFPINAIKLVLEQCSMTLSDVDHIVFYDKPLLKFERILETFLATIPKGLNFFQKAMPVWLKEKLFLKNALKNEFKKIDKNFNKSKLLFSEHHLSHAASAFYPSPFKEALILTIDGVGEWATTTVSLGFENKITILKELNFPHSIGLLYSAITYYLGFKVNSGEYKVMGLAPYGSPKYKDLFLEELIWLKDDGSFMLNQKYFDYMSGLKMINTNFEALLGQPTRQSEDEALTQFHMDVASSVQYVIEKVVILICQNIQKEYKIKNLCLAGGVALNCVANGKISKSKIFNNIWIQPASGDAGCAIGSALAYYYNELNNKRKISKIDGMSGSYLGNALSKQEIKSTLDLVGAKYHNVNDQEIIDKVANSLAGGLSVGWFQGKMEFGPRALGNRSILADPRSPLMQKKLNMQIKFRESFRPFAPAVLYEDLNKWFDFEEASPYMLYTTNINNKIKIKVHNDKLSLVGLDKLKVDRSLIPAVTHVDYSARIQTVHKETNLKFYKLIEAFKKKTKCPILVNTSFNVRGEPIVASALDAFKCFMGTGIDVLAIGDFILFKSEQNKNLELDYKEKFEKD